MHEDLRRLRAAVHRALLLNDGELLQQTCDYEGMKISDTVSTLGRTFPAKNAMIGLAYRSHRPAHTREGVSPEAIQNTMKEIGLQEAARKNGA